MAIEQYRGYSNGAWRYQAPNSTDVSQLAPAVGDWMAFKVSDTEFYILCGDFDSDLFTGTGYRVGTGGIYQLDEYTNEQLIIHDNYYVYSNMEGFKAVNNIRASTAVYYYLMFVCVFLVAYILLGRVYKWVKQLFCSRRARSV